MAINSQTVKCMAFRIMKWFIVDVANIPIIFKPTYRVMCKICYAVGWCAAMMEIIGNKLAVSYIFMLILHR